MGRPARLLLTGVGVAVCLATVPVHAALTPAVAEPQPTPGVACAPGAVPETMQGRAEDALQRRCNAVEVARTGVAGGYRVERYVDSQGHECAFSDYAAFVGEPVPEGGVLAAGVQVHDMADPARPVLTDVLRSAAMQSPHESLRLNARRGLLVAAASTVATGPGVVDVYDVAADCRHPVLLSSSPLGVLGHEGGFAPDGRTYYVASLAARTLVALDLSDPRVPRPVWTSTDHTPHGVSVSLDGTRLFVTEATGQAFTGLTVLDVGEVQSRRPSPQVRVVSRSTWPSMSAPQNATPFTRDGHRYVLEVDEFGERVTGAARILDVQDERRPRVVSDLRLAVNQPEAYDRLQADPGNDKAARGYQAHYCTLPSRVDPNIVACSFLMSGLRVFDIRDPRRPEELAYFNAPRAEPGARMQLGSQAMSAPAYDPSTHDIWYSSVTSGLHVVRLVGRARIPFAGRYLSPGN